LQAPFGAALLKIYIIFKKKPVDFSQNRATFPKKIATVFSNFKALCVVKDGFFEHTIFLVSA